MKISIKEYITMFFSFFKIGAFTFGGGYAMIPLIEKEVVEEKKWLTKDEFIDSLVVAQSLPGAIAVNTSIFVGYRIAKIKGGIIAMLGTILPSIIIIIGVALFLADFRENKYINLAFKGISGAVPILVLVAVISLSKSFKKTTMNIIMCIMICILLIFFNLSPILAIMIGIVYGLTCCVKKEAKIDDNIS
ncbi:MAG: chromate transporter [Sarcina sp.]